MHDTALKFGRIFFETYASGAPGFKVVDVGSLDVNGSLRSAVPAGCSYVGVDMAPGRGVDVLLSDPHALPFPDASVDICVSSSCLEHDEFFWLTFLEMLRILKPSGLLYLNVPTNGSVHRFPSDSWRFYPDAGLALQRWAEKNGMRVLLLESFVGRQGRDGWNDFVAVFAKDAEEKARHPHRMIDRLYDFMNGHRDGVSELLRPQGGTEDQKRRGLFWKLRDEARRRLRGGDNGGI